MYVYRVFPTRGMGSPPHQPKICSSPPQLHTKSLFPSHQKPMQPNRKQKRHLQLYIFCFDFMHFENTDHTNFDFN